MTATIYDLAGRKVALVRAQSGSALVWNGRDAAGWLVEPGIYLYRLDAGPVRREGKVVVVR